jgi:hypothetical protein
MKRLFLILALLLCSATFSFAQTTPVTTQPKSVVSYNNSSTIGVTNTFQSIWAVNLSRVACTVQNNGTHNMWVFFGPIANATENSSVLLQAGQSVSCNSGNIILQDQVSITGTASDVFFAAQQ